MIRPIGQLTKTVPMNVIRLFLVSLLSTLVACGSGSSSNKDPNSAPTGAITISGAPIAEATLTAVNGLSDANGLGTIRYQWQRDGVDISSATESTYLLTSADIGTVITVIASYTDGDGYAEQITSSATAQISPAWQDPAEQFSTGGTATGWDIATDSMGNVYVFAGVYGSEFDGLTLEYGQQVYIQKFNPSGEKLWTKPLDVAGTSSSANFHINDNDDIIVGLTVELPADDAEGALTNRAMVMALDADGNSLSGYPWSLQPTDATKYLSAFEMRVSESGDVYLRGQTEGSIDGSQTGSYYLAKFNHDGSLVWVKQFGDVALEMRAIQMTLDAEGNTFLVLNGTSDFEGTTHTWECNSNSTCRSGAIMKITDQGNIDWVKRFGQDHIGLWADAITLNAQGEVVGAFEYYFTADQTSSTLNGAALSWKNGMAMVRFDTNGNHLSTQPHGNIYDGGNWPTDLLLTDDGTLLGTGTFADSTWVSEGWLAEWDSQGVLINERAFPGSTADGLDLWALAMDPWGNTFVTGMQKYGADNNYESSLVIRKLSFD